MRIVSGKFRGKALLSPVSTATRPTSDRARQGVFNILEHNPAFSPFTWQGKQVLDVFAGTGALGLEALSRGAKSCCFVENNSEALKVLRGNIHDMGLENQSEVLVENAQLLKKYPHTFKLVFLDPPYGQELVTPTLYQLVDSQNIQEGTVVVVETEKQENFDVPSSLEYCFDRRIGIAKFTFYIAK